MATAPAWVNLGYLGQSLEGQNVLNIRQSRLGGEPVWSADPFVEASSGTPADQAVGPNTFRCGLCTGPSALVAQISAGYGSVPNRLLHILACAAGCGGCVDPRTWHVMRTVGRREEEQQPESQTEGAANGCGGTTDDWGTAASGVGEDWGDAAATGDDWGAGATASDDWGAGATASDDWGAGATASDDWGAGAVGAGEDWGVTDAGEGINAELALLLEARDAATASAAIPASASKPAGRQKKAAAKSSTRELGVTAALSGVVTAVWPCRALEVSYEPGASAQNGDHERELLERYLQSERATDEAGGEAAGAALPPEVVADLQLEEARLRSDAEVEASGREDAPMSEAEEEDDDLGEDDDDHKEGGSASPAAYFARFQRRLERSPSQVVRYSWGGQPLWMAPPPRELRDGVWPPKCGRCGAPRIFEVELLPTLLSQVNAAGKAEWGIVVVYTCSKDCAGAKDGAEPYEEFVVVQPAL
eukprot:TRINITY_DN10694_c0_g1_i1.p1 TRINITY_DN10694_c0_g1~~TRINITY_DN10694_c0_g1_i1.p1  ORF type:complete len:476 (+),score=104.82 TRINITY_DN10694_c0_g1_i1:68-1495(+)